MKDRIHDFVERLRATDVRVGVGEVVDAMEAIAALGIERETLREALAATLVKDHALRARFDALFEECFPSMAASSGDERASDSRGGAPESEGIRPRAPSSPPACSSSGASTTSRIASRRSSFS